MNNMQSNKSHYRAILDTVFIKLAMVVVGAYVVYAIYRAGYEELAWNFTILGATYAIGRPALDWRAGRKPWLPTERVVPDVIQEPSYLKKGSIVGTVLAKFTAVVLSVYVAYILYRNGLERLAVGFTFAIVLYAIGHPALEWRAGRKPWLPMKRVQRLDSE